MYNYESLPERYNMADTLKAQHTAFLTAGCVCYSDMGRILCSITADSCGWHDTICGLSDAAMVAAEYGAEPFSGTAQRRSQERPRQHAQRAGQVRPGQARPDRQHQFLHARDGRRGRRRCVSTHSTAAPATMSSCASRCIRCWCSRPASIRSTLTRTTSRGRCGCAPGVSGPAPEHDPCRERCEENARGFRNTEMMFPRMIDAASMGALRAR